MNLLARPLLPCLAAVLIFAVISPAVRAEEADFTFDGNEYFLRSTEGGILEYLTSGETFKNWTTLFTIREFSGTDDPKAYAEKLLENAKASSPDAQGMIMENAEDKGVKHKLGVYVFAKDGGDKAFLLSTWTPEAALTDNAGQIFAMLGSIKLD